MKIAILSCNTGGGHNAAAAALAEELSARGHESRTYNTLDFLPKGAADLISRGHDFAYRYAPKLYGAGYRMEEKRPSPLLYENSIRGIGPLYEALVDLGADAAICVHVFPAMMMTGLRCGYGLRMPTWFVATDFTCSPGVGELQLDGICIPHPALTLEFQAAGLPPSASSPRGSPSGGSSARPRTGTPPGGSWSWRAAAMCSPWPAAVWGPGPCAPPPPASRGCWGRRTGWWRCAAATSGCTAR